MLDGGENGNYLPIGANCEGQMVPANIKELLMCPSAFATARSSPKAYLQFTLTMHVQQLSRPILLKPSRCTPIELRGEHNKAIGKSPAQCKKKKFSQYNVLIGQRVALAIFVDDSS